MSPTPGAFNLDNFAPAPVVFTLEKREYRISGDPDVDVVARMLRIEEQIRESETVETTADAVKEGKELLQQMILEYDVDQDVSGFRLGSTQVLTLFSLILHGGTVAAVVARALVGPGEGIGDGDDAVTTGESAAPDAEDDADAAPLASASVSSGRSSSSDDTGDGPLATGLA